jgi:AcrR family transcriptional regulator
MAVAREQLVLGGPAGLRLDGIAKEVGVTRQAILHHFGSRAGLLRTVVERAWTGLFIELTQAMTATSDPSLDALVDRMDDVVRRQGNGVVGAWLILSGEGLPDEVLEGALAQVVPRLAESRGVPEEQAEFTLLLLATALFGDAVFGGRFRQILSSPDNEEQRAKFRRRLAALLA